MLFNYQMDIMKIYVVISNKYYLEIQIGRLILILRNSEDKNAQQMTAYVPSKYEINHLAVPCAVIDSLSF